MARTEENRPKKDEQADSGQGGENNNPLAQAKAQFVPRAYLFTVDCRSQ
jgi:hypothetical protein